jgi:hypothetical protein
MRCWIRHLSKGGKVKGQMDKSDAYPLMGPARPGPARYHPVSEGGMTHELIFKLQLQPKATLLFFTFICASS